MNTTSVKKQELIDKFYSELPTVGERVLVKNKYVIPSYDQKNINLEDFASFKQITVTEVNSKTGTVKGKEQGYSTIITVPKGDYKRNTYNVGENPFHQGAQVSSSGFTLESILFQLGLIDGNAKERYFLEETNGEGVPVINWNPYVIDKNGDKHYYQREFCWELEDKQLLIESLYNGIECGKVLIRPRLFKWIEKEVKKGNKDIAWYDVVDGKQRLHTVYEFINDKFPDKHGNYYSDLSSHAQNRLLDNQLISSSEFKEGVSDKDVIETFIRLNQFGKVVEKSHMNIVNDINNKL